MIWVTLLSVGLALSIAIGGCWLLVCKRRSPIAAGTNSDAHGGIAPVAITLAAAVSSSDCGDAGALSSGSDT